MPVSVADVIVDIGIADDDDDDDDDDSGNL
jgi:hypothetical protein